VRANILILTCAVALGGCGAIQQAQFEKARDETRAAVIKCTSDNAGSPEGQLLAKRLWLGGSDTVAAKLTDPKPLTQPEKDALGIFHGRALQCRQIADNWDSQHSPHAMPAATAWHARSDAIYLRYISGDPVGEVNKAAMASWDQFQSDTAQANANAIATAQAQDAQVRAQAAQGAVAAALLRH
jgi:hypothetical protein